MLEAIALGLPEAERVDVAEWGDHPTFRVRGKSFVFAAGDGSGFGVKLSREESAALVATDGAVSPMGYGLGRHGWVQIALTGQEDEARWGDLAELVRTSYCLVAPRRLARLVEPEPGVR